MKREKDVNRRVSVGEENWSRFETKKKERRREKTEEKHEKEIMGNQRGGREEGRRILLKGL